MANHNLECQEYWKQEAVETVIVHKIIHEGVDAMYIKELDDDFIGYNTQMTKLIIKFLCREWCIITTLEQKQAAQLSTSNGTSHPTSQISHMSSTSNKICAGTPEFLQQMPQRSSIT
jgi:hypothetical protein